MSIRIAGTGSYVPDRVMTNADLEKMVETSDEWIRTRTGIQERRIAAPEQATSDLAYEAGKRALEMAGITGDQLSVIIVATITHRLHPAETLRRFQCVLLRSGSRLLRFALFARSRPFADESESQI